KACTGRRLDSDTGIRRGRHPAPLGRGKGASGAGSGTRKEGSTPFQTSYGKDVDRRPTRPHDIAIWWIDLETRKADPRGAGRPRVSGGSIAHPERERIPTRQGVWQQRTVQPDVLHGWQPRPVPADARRARPDETGNH